MTPLRRWSAIGDDPDSLDVEVSRLLCDYGPSASCRDGAGKAQTSRGGDGWPATGQDAGSRMRQGDKVVLHGRSDFGQRGRCMLDRYLPGRKRETYN